MLRYDTEMRNPPIAQTVRFLSFKANVDGVPDDDTVQFDTHLEKITINGTHAQHNRGNDGMLRCTTYTASDACGEATTTLTIDPKTATARITQSHTIKLDCLPIDTEYWSTGNGPSARPNTTTQTTTTLHMTQPRA